MGNIVDFCYHRTTLTIIIMIIIIIIIIMIIIIMIFIIIMIMIIIVIIIIINDNINNNNNNDKNKINYNKINIRNLNIFSLSLSCMFSRDTLIEQLLREINELKSRLSQLRAEDDRIINALRERIAKLERDLEELQQIAAQACEENVALKKEVEEASTHGEAVVKLVEAESK